MAGGVGNLRHAGTDANGGVFASSVAQLLLAKGRVTAPALSRRAGANRTADLVPALDEFQQRGE